MQRYIVTHTTVQAQLRELPSSRNADAIYSEFNYGSCCTTAGETVYGTPFLTAKVEKSYCRRSPLEKGRHVNNNYQTGKYKTRITLINSIRISPWTV